MAEGSDGQMSVFKPKGRKSFTVRVGNRYAYGIANRTLAKQIESQWKFERQAGRHGLIDPKAGKYAQHDRRPLADHADDYEKHLLAEKRTEQYARETVGWAKYIFNAAGIDRISRIERHDVLVQCDKLTKRAKGDSIRTRNKALAACKSFVGWLFDGERIPNNTLARMKALNVDRDRRRIRAELNEDQIVSLLTVTPTQKTRGGMTGIDRKMRYLLGLGTGLRQGTLFSLTPESFQLDHPRGPQIVAEARNVKSRVRIEQPISVELAAVLRPWLATKPKGKPVFPKLPHGKPMIAYRRDLEAAGIPYQAGSNIYHDQHAHRNTFITRILRETGDLKVAQDLAHHSTPLLTSKYGRLTMTDYSRAVTAALPARAIAPPVLPDSAGRNRTKPDGRKLA